MTCSENQCGTGFGSVTFPTDPSNNSVVSATPAFGGIDVSWSYPTTNPQAVVYTELYRGLLPDFNASLMIANVGGNTYYDKAPTDNPTKYYYWIRIVSINGTVGDPIGPASATSRPPIANLIEQLSQKIEYGTLNNALKASIDNIHLNYQALMDEITARQNGEQSLSNALLLTQTSVDNALMYINQEIAARQDGDSALVQQVNTVATATANNLATVQQTLQTSITHVDDKTTALGALYTVKVDVNGLVGGFGVYNDGSSVEAGFNVDTFWVGRTGTDKKKPFIISGSEVFINQAVIQNASIDIAKVNTATIANLSALNANMGNITAGQIRFNRPGDPSSCIILDSATQTLQVYNAGVLRVKIGNLG
jgi:hypothetical protein